MTESNNTELKETIGDLSRGSNMVADPLKIVFNFSRFKPAPNWNRFLADLSRVLNSLNSDTGSFVNLQINLMCIQYPQFKCTSLRDNLNEEVKRLS